MTPRKIFAIIGLLCIVPAIAIIRSQTTGTEGGTAVNISSVALYTAMVIFPALYSEHLWRKLQVWIPDHRVAEDSAAIVVWKRTRRERALLQRTEIEAREADHAYEAERIKAIYERGYLEGRNAANNNNV